MQNYIGLQHKVNPPYVLDQGVSFTKRPLESVADDARAPVTDNADTTGKRSKAAIAPCDSILSFLQQQSKSDEALQVKLFSVLDRFLNGPGVAAHVNSSDSTTSECNGSAKRDSSTGCDSLSRQTVARLEALREKYPGLVFRIMVELTCPTYQFTQHDVPVFTRLANTLSKKPVNILLVFVFGILPNSALSPWMGCAC